MAHAALALTALAFAAPAAADAKAPPPYHGASAADMRWWTQARFGMFIHWGAYSIKGVEASWPLYGGQVPRAEYEGLATQFNPTLFDPRAVARLAKAAGQKYVIITSKHHDGYAMFDTKLSDYSVMHSPYGRDIIRMLGDACRAEGLRFGVYFSLCDWHHPDYMTGPRSAAAGPGLLPEQLDPARWERFVDFVHGQIRELLTNYGRMDVMWFDGGWEHSPEQWKALELHRMIRRLQPHTIINDRGTGGYGDYGTPEQTIPEGGMARPWETCMTINNTWAYNPTDPAHKSTDELLTNLAKTSSGGGNYLLDIGPMPTGQVQPEFVERLEAMGRWLAANGASVYGTQAGPRRLVTGAYATRAGRRVYVHIIEPPLRGRLALTVGENRPTRAWVLATGKALPLRVRKTDGKAFVDLSGVQGDLRHQVVVVELAADWEEAVLGAGPDGSVALEARDVMAHGSLVCYQPTYDDIGCWLNPADWVSWSFRLTREADYEVVVNQGAPPGEGGTYRLTVGGKPVAAEVKITTGWVDYQDVSLGRVHLKPGKCELSIRPVKFANSALMNIRRVRVVPAP
jgi:alpha-L-fucosidase